CQQFHTYPYSF
nr:immunoglobulin light chain junction region [Macaca mulatta]